MVNIVSYYFCSRVLRQGAVRSNVSAWLAAVIFAYLTNRKWVFGSSAAGLGAAGREILAFAACRLATGILDMAVMHLGCDIMKMDDMWVKCLADILVILANYAAGKSIVFKK